MSGYIAQFSTLIKLNSLQKKLDFINKVPGFENFGFVFYAKKTFIKSIGGSESTAIHPIQAEIDQR